MRAPRSFLCDEPTESLSPERAAEIVDLLLDINADGVTTVVATHDFSTVNRLRRRVIHMGDGCVQSRHAGGLCLPALPRGRIGLGGRSPPGRSAQRLRGLRHRDPRCTALGLGSHN